MVHMASYMHYFQFYTCFIENLLTFLLQFLHFLRPLSHLYTPMGKTRVALYLEPAYIQACTVQHPGLSNERQCIKTAKLILAPNHLQY
jgi:hypothetical protein